MRNRKDIYRAVEDWTSGSLIVGGLGLMLFGVVMRYFFGKPLYFADELSLYMVIWGALLGTVVALRDNAHIRVDILYRYLPERWKHRMNAFASAVGIVFSLFMLVYGIKGIFLDQHSVYRLKLSSLGMGIELWKVYLILPIIGLMFLVRFVQRFVRSVRGLPETEADEGAEAEWKL